MKDKSNLIILDIGSHKLEELQTLLCPFPRQFGIYVVWFAKQLLKSVIKRDLSIFSDLRKQLDVIHYYFLSARRYNLTVVSIEPNPAVVLPHVARLSEKYKTIFIPAAVLGHDAVVSSDLRLLYSYNHSISSSLYKKDRTMEVAQHNVCVGLRLGVIWSGLVREGIASSDSEIILRMNCEGAELGVLKDCEDIGLNVKCVIGSIGDVDKIHGSEFGDAAREIMNKLGIEYHYFKGDDPSTWHSTAAVLSANTIDYTLEA